MREKTKKVHFQILPNILSSIIGHMKGNTSEFEFQNLKDLRKILNNEKARVLYTIKAYRPKSIYDLAKKLGRGFKTVNEDIRLLKRFGFIDLVPSQKGKRKCLKPIVLIENLQVTMSFC